MALRSFIASSRRYGLLTFEAKPVIAAAEIFRELW
jgi:hypothetical protein